MRLDLKVAIIRSGHSQRDISAQTRIPEARLSSIVRGWVAPRPEEQLALQQHLRVGPDAFNCNSDTLETRSVR
jgi:hypothetical protein